MLKLFYITNNTEIARIAESAGVDRIFVDMEYIGKELRQPKGMDTVKNHHTIDDVKRIKSVLNKAELLVRVNPIHEGSEDEIEQTVLAGADVIMLPYWKTPEEVTGFLQIVNGRAKTILLLETDEAVRCIDTVINNGGFDEIYIGLNDLRISQGKTFLFELVTDGTVDKLVGKFKAANLTFGFGGVGRVGTQDLLPAENVLCEHYRLGSSMVILSRSFCNTEKTSDLNKIQTAFNEGVRQNREYEQLLERSDDKFFIEKHISTEAVIDKIVSNIKRSS